MNHGPARRPARASSKKPRAHFNWPPTDDDLAEYREELLQRSTEVEHAGIQADQQLAVDVSLPTGAIALFPSEAPGSALPAVLDQPSPTSFDSRLALVGDRPAARVILRQPESLRTRPASSPQPSTSGDSAQARSGGADLEHSRTEATSTSGSGIAVSPSSAAGDLPGSADLADEIAHLQALIEGLTQKIEWRIPTVGRP